MVRGLSMAPNLGYGDELLIRYTEDVAVGDVIVFRRERQNDVKRVASISDEGIYVLGDNPMASLDSRNYGHINPDQVLGKAIFRLKPKLGRISNNRFENPAT
ncbi:MAG: S26 family signal peptidase [Actinobacteria bacterium]|nr:S26 family signal peptidase [Actinomycetota bacterium]